MAGKSFFGRIMGRNQSETQAAVPMSQVNSAPRDDKTYEFNTRLGSSYLNVVNYGTKCTAPYSTEEITRMARDPMQYISELRQWAKWAYYSNGTVTTAIDSLVSLHSLDYVVVVKPKKAGGSRKGCRASMDKMTSVLRSMRYKEVIRDGLFHDANEGMYVGYMETRTVPVDDRLALTDLDIQGITEINSAGVNCVVISLPVEYTRIIGRRNNCYEVAFDLRYFSAMTEGDRKRKLQGFPRQIQEGWRRYSNGEFPDGACWQRLDWRKTIVTKIKSGQNDPYGVPFAVAALDDIDYAKYFINTKRRVLDTVNNQIYYETFPEGKDKGTSALSQSQQENQHNTVKQALTQRSNTNGVSFFSLASGTKMDRLPVDLSLLNEENENAIKEDVNEDIGVAAAALSGSSTGNYATATLNMEIVANNVFTWIEALVEELNKCLNYNVIRDGSYRVEFRVLPITFVNREKQVKFFSDLYATSLLWILSWMKTLRTSTLCIRPRSLLPVRMRLTVMWTRAPVAILRSIQAQSLQRLIMLTQAPLRQDKEVRVCLRELLPLSMRSPVKIRLPADDLSRLYCMRSSLITLVGRKTESRGKRNMFKLTSTPLSECRL